MTMPVDHIITELTELATSLYDFLLHTEGQSERAGWVTQIEHYRKRVFNVRMLAGRSDYRGLHGVCLIQQEYLNSVLVDSHSPTSLDWEQLERWPLLVLPCLATPLSVDAVDELVEYCRNMRTGAARDLDTVELRDHLLKSAAPKATVSPFASLPFAIRGNAPADESARKPVNEQASNRYLLRHELLDALNEYHAQHGQAAAAPHEALRLCADRIQLLGISAAGAGLVGLMDCCLLCHDTLNRYVTRHSLLGQDENESLKHWVTLVAQYLETPDDQENIDALMNFYLRGHFIAKLADRDYQNLRDLLTRDGVVPSVAHIELNDSSNAFPHSVTARLRDFDQQLTKIIESKMQLQQHTRDLLHKLSENQTLHSGEMTTMAQRLIEISHESHRASQDAKKQLDSLAELFIAKIKSPVASTTPDENTANNKHDEVMSPVQALLVRCSGQVLAVSIRGVARVFHAGSGEPTLDEHRLHYCVDETCFDACELETLLQLPVDRAWVNKNDRTAVLVNEDGQHGQVVFVESVIAAKELEVKTIGPYMPSFPGIMGVTLLTDGHMIPVIDLPGLLRMSVKRTDESAMEFMTENGELS